MKKAGGAGGWDGKRDTHRDAVDRAIDGIASYTQDLCPAIIIVDHFMAAEGTLLGLVFSLFCCVCRSGS